MVQELDDWARRLGMHRGNLIAVATAIGLKVIQRAIAPEEVISTKALADLVEEMHRRGYDFEKESLLGVAKALSEV